MKMIRVFQKYALIKELVPKPGWCWNSLKAYRFYTKTAFEIFIGRDIAPQ
jgi:hypothetical protein